MKFVHTADTHLGYEITKLFQCHPRGRKRRAESIIKNFLAVVQHALNDEVDLFIHSGDLFNKYYIPRETLDSLIQPIFDLVHAGIPVLIIPGNHERSQFPFDLFHGSSRIFVFDRPKSLSLVLDGYSVGIAGFPFIRDNSKRTFLNALHETEYEGLRSDFNLLVTHQAFDMATVGPVNFTFRPGRSDTVLRQTIPLDFEYIAAGHIHRYRGDVVKAAHGGRWGIGRTAWPIGRYIGSEIRQRFDLLRHGIAQSAQIHRQSLQRKLRKYTPN